MLILPTTKTPTEEMWELATDAADSDDFYAIEDCMWLLRGLAKNTEVDQRAAPLIVSVLRKSQNTYGASLATCAVLADLINHDTTPFAEAIPLIVTALAKWRKNAKFCEIGTHALVTICPGKWRICAEAGAFSLLVQILKLHSENVYICKHASRGLACMLKSPHPDLKTPNYHDVERVVAADGVRTLVEIIDNHIDSEQVCISAIGALRLISPFESVECVLPFLLELVEQNSTKDALAYSIAYLLLEVSTNYNLNEKSCKLAISTLQILLQENLYNSAICKFAAAALANVIGNNANHANSLNIKEVLLELQDYYTNEKEITNPICKVLHRIADKHFTPHQHNLSPKSHNGVCDICSAETGEFMKCEECDYDECLLCFRP